MKNSGSITPTKWPRLWAIIIMAAILALLFWRSFLPEYVHFSNDGPLGQIGTAFGKMPAAFTGSWDDLNDTGYSAGVASPSVAALLIWFLGPLLYAKFFPAIAIFVLGLGAWTFFRASKFSWLACLFGALAAMLNSTYFATACWGVASQGIALGFGFFALALFVANTKETPFLVRWARLALAGLCVGLNVMDGADVGALNSLLIAAFVLVKTLAEPDGPVAIKLARGASRVAVIAVFAGFIAAQTIFSLVGTAIQGVAGTAQDTETKAQHWDWATQWSMPKKETLGLMVPGLFGYKMDTPKDMMPALQDAYRGGVYWGGVGRAPELDRYFDSGSQGPEPSGPGLFMRFTGGENYCGILVLLIAGWAAAQSFRRQNSPFPMVQKKIVWFWTAVAVISLPLAWGRFAPGSHTSNGFLFYAFLYKLPYFSTIRNPSKFLSFFSWAIVMLFAHGVQALTRHLDGSASKSADLMTQVSNWWARASRFDRRWVFVCGGLLGASVLGWLVFWSERPDFIEYLQKRGFPDEAMARSIASFSLGQLGWFLPLLAVAIGLLTLVLANYFSGPRARIGAILLGAFLVFDLGRANLPYLVHWDYKQKYEIGTLNPVVDFLRKNPYEHRVVGLPFHAPEGLELLDELYRIEWVQQLFPYYNIQCLDVIQMPRMPADLKMYIEALSPNGTQESAPLLARRWLLSNTRYLLGPAGYLDVLNQQLDPGKNRFRMAQRFEIVPKPGIAQPTRLEELTAVPNPEGRYALFEFDGALPRAKLYSNWQVNTNDQAVLKTLADLNFDPAKTVLISTPEKNLPAWATNEDTGTVEFKSYAPKKIVFTAQAKSPSVLLLNDKYDPHWRASVDGQPAALLRCNFLMRGVSVPPGTHTVEFDFSIANNPLYVTVAGLGTGLLLSLFLLVATRRGKTA